MGLNHSPKIITNGLVLCLDAANRKSYPGSGSIWNDCVNNNVGTFTGSPTFNSSGYLTFSGSGQYVTFPSNANFALGTGDFTIDLWVNPANNSQNSGLFQLSSSATYFTSSFSNQLSFQMWLGYIQLGYNGSWNVGNGVAANAYVGNRWYYLTVSRVSSVTRFYINGIQVSADLSDTANYTGTYLLVAGFYNTPNVFNGLFSNMRIYKNKGLTPSEIQQNFNALKGRFGI